MGWRRSKAEAAGKTAHTTVDSALPWISSEELAKHTTREAGVWIVVGDKVFDVARFMQEEHPGGEDVIFAFAGKQCDWQFALCEINVCANPVCSPSPDLAPVHRAEHLEMHYDELVVGRMAHPPSNPYPRPPRELKAAWRVE